MPRQVQIGLGRSGSAASRQLDRELALLDAYFKRAGTIAVTLTRFADVAHAGERFMVKNGDWTALRRALQATVYDGATQLGAVRTTALHRKRSGLQTALPITARIGGARSLVPAYMVHSSTSADPAALQAVAEASGGRSIDLTVLTQAAGRRCVAVARYANCRSLGPWCEGSRRRVTPCERRSSGSRRDAHCEQRRSDAAGAWQRRQRCDANRAHRHRAQRVAAGRVAVGAPDARVAGRRHKRQQGAQYARSAGASAWRRARRRYSCSNRSTTTSAMRSSRLLRCVRRMTGWQPLQRRTVRRAMQRGWHRSCVASRRESPGGIVRFRKMSRPKSCRSPRRRQERSGKPKNCHATPQRCTT